MKTFKPSDLKIKINVKHHKLLVLWALVAKIFRFDIKWLFNFCVKVG